MVRLATEGWREMLVVTIVAVLVGGGLAWLHPLASLLILPVWIWAIAFFRDPQREICAAAHELCAPADGTVTEITELEMHPLVGGPAVRIGIFLSIFNVHINRAPCAGTVRFR